MQLRESCWVVVSACHIMRIVNFFIFPDWPIGQYWKIKSLRCVHHVCSLSLRSSAVLRTAPPCLAPLRAAAPCSASLRHFAPLRDAPRCCASLRTSLFCTVPGEIQDYNVEGVEEGPGLFPSLINNIILPQDGLASSDRISRAYTVRGRGREAGR